MATEGDSSVCDDDGSMDFYLQLLVQQNDLKLLEDALNNSKAEIDTISPFTGFTALIQACKLNNINAVKLLIEHGADPSILLPDHGTALDVAIFEEWRRNLNDRAISEFLIKHINHRLSLSFASFVISIGTPIFEGIFNKLDNIRTMVDASRFELRRFGCVLQQIEITPPYYKLLFLQQEHFQMFLHKYCEVIEFWVNNCVISDIFVDDTEIDRDTMINVIDNLYFVLDSEFLDRDELEALRDDELLIVAVVEKMYKLKIALDQVTKFILHLVSYGIINLISTQDLILIYHYYGHCDLFKILMFTEIQVNIFGAAFNLHLIRAPKINWKFRNVNANTPILPYVIVDLSLNPVPKIVTKFSRSRKLISLLEYFVDKELTKKCLEIDQKYTLGLAEKIQKLPRLPSLIELARNSLRSLVIEKYQVKTSSQFYTRLNSLGGGRIVFDITSYATKLYPML